MYRNGFGRTLGTSVQGSQGMIRPCNLLYSPYIKFFFFQYDLSSCIHVDIIVLECRESGRAFQSYECFV
jgi:hypothetical protein